MGQFLSWLIRRRQACGGRVVDARRAKQKVEIQEGLKLAMKS